MQQNLLEKGCVKETTFFFIRQELLEIQKTPFAQQKMSLKRRLPNKQQVLLNLYPLLFLYIDVTQFYNVNICLLF